MVGVSLFGPPPHVNVWLVISNEQLFGHPLVIRQRTIYKNPPPLRHFGLLGSKAKAFPFEFLAKKSILLFCTISATIVDLRKKTKTWIS